MLFCNRIITCKFIFHKIQRSSLRVLIESLMKSEHRSCCQRNCSGFEGFGSGSTRGCSIYYRPCGSTCNVGFSKGCHGRLCYAYSGGKAGPGRTGGCRQSAEISPGKLQCEQLHENRKYFQQNTTDNKAARNVSFLVLPAAVKQYQHAYVKQCRWLKYTLHHFFER